MFIKSLRMTGFEPWISGVRGDRSTTEPLTAQPNRLIQDPLIQDPMSLEYYLRNNSFITRPITMTKGPLPMRLLRGGGQLAGLPF